MCGSLSARKCFFGLCSFCILFYGQCTVANLTRALVSDYLARYSCLTHHPIPLVFGTLSSSPVRRDGSSSICQSYSTPRFELQISVLTPRRDSIPIERNLRTSPPSALSPQRPLMCVPPSHHDCSLPNPASYLLQTVPTVHIMISPRKSAMCSSPFPPLLLAPISRSSLVSEHAVCLLLPFVVCSLPE